MSYTKHARLLSYRDNADYFLIGDCDRKTYHRKDCPVLDSQDVRKSSLLPIRYTIGRGWKPCPRCAPVVPVRPAPRRERDTTLGGELCRIAEKYGMRARLIGFNLYVTTICDEWFFDYQASPTILHHKNTERRTDRMGRALEGDYHRQPKEFETPFQALVYIKNHTGSAVGRALAPRIAQLRLTADGEEPPRLFCGARELLPGDTVTALFPDGWNAIVLGYRAGAEDAGHWYIATPAFSPFTPVGLFAQVPQVPEIDTRDESEKAPGPWPET